MIYIADVSKLKAACDKILLQEDLKPEVDAKGNLINTYCNLGVYRIARELGVDKFFYNTTTARPMLATEIALACAENSLRFEHVEPERAKSDADSGLLVIAAQVGVPGVNGGHGHVDIVYPGKPMTYSGKWGMLVPVVANIGKQNLVEGTNYAFGAKVPNFYSMRIG